MDAKPIMTPKPLMTVAELAAQGAVDPEKVVRAIIRLDVPAAGWASATRPLYATEDAARILRQARHMPAPQWKHHVRKAVALAVLLALPGCCDKQMTIRTEHIYAAPPPIVLGPDVRSCPQAQFCGTSLPPHDAPTVLEPVAPVRLEVQPSVEPRPTTWRAVPGVPVPRVQD